MLPLIYAAFTFLDKAACLANVFRAKGVLWFAESNRRQPVHLSAANAFTMIDSDSPQGKPSAHQGGSDRKGPLIQAGIKAAVEACLAER